MSALVDFDSLWDYGNAAATEAKFRALLPVLQESADSGKCVELLTQVARTEGLQGKFAEAHATLDVAQRLLGVCGARGNVRYLLERGRVLNSSGQPVLSQPLFERAWDVAVEAGEDRLAADAAHMVAIVAPIDEKLAWTEKALVFLQTSADPKAPDWLGPLYNNVGWTYLEAGRHQDALDAFRKALDFRIEKGAVKPIRIARYAVGRALRSLGQVSEALEIQQALHAEWGADGQQKSPYADEEIGECLLLLERPAGEAAPFFASAFAELSQDAWLAEHEPARLDRLRELGKTAE